MEKSLKTWKGKRAVLLTLGVLLAIVFISAVFYLVKSRIELESISFVAYEDPEMEANITEIGPSYYVLIAKKGRNFRLGIMNETMLAELISSVNLILAEAKEITSDEFNSSRINVTRSSLGSKEPKGVNLTVINDVRVDLQIFPNLTLIRLETTKKTLYYRSTSLNLSGYFEGLYKWSKNQTDKMMNLVWMKLRERGKAPFKYGVGSIKVNLTSDKPIQITMIWQGCPCSIRPPEVFQLSVEEITGG